MSAYSERILNAHTQKALALGVLPSELHDEDNKPTQIYNDLKFLAAHRYYTACPVIRTYSFPVTRGETNLVVGDLDIPQNKYEGEWDASREDYEQGDIVYFQESSNYTESNAYKGVYSSEKLYQNGDIVNYRGELWVAVRVRNNVTGDAHIFGLAPGENDKWEMLPINVKLYEAKENFSTLSNATTDMPPNPNTDEMNGGWKLHSESQSVYNLMSRVLGVSNFLKYAFLGVLRADHILLGENYSNVLGFDSHLAGVSGTNIPAQNYGSLPGNINAWSLYDPRADIATATGRNSLIADADVSYNKSNDTLEIVSQTQGTVTVDLAFAYKGSDDDNDPSWSKVHHNHLEIFGSLVAEAVLEYIITSRSSAKISSDLSIDVGFLQNKYNSLKDTNIQNLNGIATPVMMWA